MAKFTKGNQAAKGKGRPKAQKLPKNIKALLRTEAFLAEKNFHPLEKLIEILPKLDEMTQARYLLELWGYIQAKPKPKEEPEQLPEEDDLPDTEAQLLNLIKDDK